MTDRHSTDGFSMDAALLVAIAVVWLVTAACYHLLPMINMPPGERVWTLSGVGFGLVALLLVWTEWQIDR